MLPSIRASSCVNCQFIALNIDYNTVCPKQIENGVACQGCFAKIYCNSECQEQDRLQHESSRNNGPSECETIFRAYASTNALSKLKPELDNIFNEPYLLNILHSFFIGKEWLSDSVKNTIENINHNIIHFDDLDEQQKQNRDIILEFFKLKQDDVFIRLDISLKSDREFILKAVKHYGCVLNHVDELFLRDKEIVIEAVTTSGIIAYCKAHDTLKEDRDVILALVNRRGMYLYNAGKQAQNDKKIVLAALQENRSAFKYASQHLQRDPDVRKAAGLI